MRNIAGLLIAIGRAEAPVEFAREVLAGRDRTRYLPGPALRQHHVIPRIAHVTLAKGRIARMREDLVDTSTGHDIPRQKQFERRHGNGSSTAWAFAALSR